MHISIYMYAYVCEQSPHCTITCLVLRHLAIWAAIFGRSLHLKFTTRLSIFTICTNSGVLSSTVLNGMKLDLRESLYWRMLWEWTTVWKYWGNHNLKQGNALIFMWANSSLLVVLGLIRMNYCVVSVNAILYIYIYVQIDLISLVAVLDRNQIVFHCIFCTRHQLWHACEPCPYMSNSRGGSAGIRNLYLYVTSSGDICDDNWSYVVVAQRKNCVRWQISAPSIPGCVCLNDLSFKICVFQVVKSLHSRRDCCYCYRCHVRML